MPRKTFGVIRGSKKVNSPAFGSEGRLSPDETLAAIKLSSKAKFPKSFDGSMTYAIFKSLFPELRKRRNAKDPWAAYHGGMATNRAWSHNASETIRDLLVRDIYVLCGFPLLFAGISVKNLISGATLAGLCIDGQHRMAAMEKYFEKNPDAVIPFSFCIGITQIQVSEMLGQEKARGPQARDMVSAGLAAYESDFVRGFFSEYLRNPGLLHNGKLGTPAHHALFFKAHMKEIEAAHEVVQDLKVSLQLRGAVLGALLTTGTTLANKDRLRGVLAKESKKCPGQRKPKQIKLSNGIYLDLFGLNKDMSSMVLDNAITRLSNDLDDLLNTEERLKGKGPKRENKRARFSAARSC